MRGAHWQGDNNPGHARRLERMAAIEAEFGEPLAETIMGLREQGNSWRTVAGALEVSPSTLKGWRRALGLPLAKEHKVFDESSLPEHTPSDCKARALGYRGLVDAIRQMRLGEQMTVRQVAERLGVSVGTVVHNTPAEARVAQARTPAKVASALRNLSRVKRRGYRGHPWRRDEDARRCARAHCDGSAETRRADPDRKSVASDGSRANDRGAAGGLAALPAIPGAKLPPSVEDAR